MTKIEWTHRSGTTGVTWNPVTGCTPISEGCRNCYAKRMSKRLAGRFGYPEDEPFRVTLHPDRLEEPFRWRKPRTVFVCSMGDLFHEDVPFDHISQIAAVMQRAQHHTFLVLTKRPRRMLEWLVWSGFGSKTLPNVWLGVTIEKPEYAYRAEYLRHCPAAVRFLSLEPLLASLDGYPGIYDDMNWVIVGGETGPGARPMHPDWARNVRDQCQAAGVPFFFKQQGEWGCAGSPEEDWGFVGGYAINDPFRGGRFAVDDKMRANKRANYRYYPESNTVMIRSGKKHIDQLLDGKEHREWPTV